MTYYLEGQSSCPNVQATLSKDNRLLIDTLGYLAESPLKKQKKPFDTNGIALAFSKLDSPLKIQKFANSYGMLGLDHGYNLRLNVDYWSEFRLAEESPSESVDEWIRHIKTVQKILKLYKAIVEDLPIKDKLIHLKESGSGKVVCWSVDGEQSIVTLENEDYLLTSGKRRNEGNYTFMGHSEHERFKGIAETVINAYLHTVLVARRSTYIDYYAPYRFEEEKFFGLNYSARMATNYLLALIYHDLHRIVNKRKGVRYCQVCGDPIPEGKRADSVTCGGTCRTTKSRTKSKGGVENG